TRERPLLELLGDFVNAPSLAAARTILDASPALLSDEAKAILANNVELLRSRGNAEAAEQLGRYVAILHRSRVAGIDTAFREAEAADPVAPAELTPLLEEASAAEKRFD